MEALFDSHTHLQLSNFDKDREAVIERAREAGVEGMVVVGIDAGGGRQAAEMASRYTDVYAAIGYHPHEAKDVDDRALQALRDLARERGVVALGEIGLDFYRNLSPREAQLRAFRQQLEIALELNLPVIIHSRNAQQETAAVLEEWLADSAEGLVALGSPLGVIHCFSGDARLAGRYVSMGFLISTAGNITYPNANSLRRALASVPLEHMLVETDCPFLAPQVDRGRRCEPRHVRETAAALAAVKGVSPDEVAAVTTRNARMLYRLQEGQS